MKMRPELKNGSVRRKNHSQNTVIISYFSGVNEPRRSVTKKPLPSPRLISNVLIPDLDKQEKATTLAFVQWTQFIANDLFHTPISKMGRKSFWFWGNHG